jgi:hypothetical protein
MSTVFQRIPSGGALFSGQVLPHCEYILVHESPACFSNRMKLYNVVRGLTPDERDTKVARYVGLCAEVVVALGEAFDGGI